MPKYRIRSYSLHYHPGSNTGRIRLDLDNNPNDSEITKDYHLNDFLAIAAVLNSSPKPYYETENGGIFGNHTMC